MTRLTQNERDRIKGWFEGHKASERKSISWHMNSVDEHGRYQSNYAYSVTWTPGTLCIAGDIGEFTVTHYQAMRTIEQTIKWLDGIDFHYLMEKSTGTQVYDEDATFSEIVRMANEEALDSLKCLRDDRRRYRADCADGRAEYERTLIEWREVQPSDDPEPALVDFIPGDGDVMKLEITERRFTFSQGRRHDVPDGWWTWYRIWEELLDYEQPSVIFTKDGRDRLKEELRGRLGDEHSAANLCSDLGLDDFYGCREYPFQCHVWHAAIQAWVKLAKPEYMKTAMAAA